MESREKRTATESRTARRTASGDEAAQSLGRRPGDSGIRNGVGSDHLTQSFSAYQSRKARLIAAVLLQAAAVSDTPMSQLAALAARMNHRQWITVSMQAGVPVAEHSARVLVVALLGGLA